MSDTVQLRTGPYLDSVRLMQVTRRVRDVPGVTGALVAMATQLNRELADGMGFEVPGDVSPNLLLVAVRAADDASLEAGLAEAERALGEAGAGTGPRGPGEAPPPLTVRAAARRSDATVALISTPGRHAVADAVDAVDAGLLTMVFSDNVPLADERALKRYAEDAGVLVMGPDCGTAVVGGVGLGFANVVRPGPVGIVAASGTGAQHLMCLLDAVGIGVSHCLGVGGRDLSEAVRGISTHRALDLLAADEATEVVVVVSKPPAGSVADTVEAHAAALGKPVVLALLGPTGPDLTEVASEVAGLVGVGWREPPVQRGALEAARGPGHLRGLFAGGTLCDEAMLLASASLGEVRSNIPLRPEWALGEDLSSHGHTMIDFGDDRLTRGRPHPMIDGSQRAERLLREVADLATGAVLLDVVLGLGAADDPAAELTAAVTAATADGVPVLATLVGTRDDPQDKARQARLLRHAGAWVFESNAAAARVAAAMVGAAHADGAKA